EPRHPKMDGVSTYLALTFGTLLSSQGTDASFVPVSGPSGRFPSFPTLPDSFSVPFPVWNSIQWPLEGLLPFGAFTTLADSLGYS
ncbi:hypothetical protein, partial [Streptomyces sp. NPDC051098]|uniref:hypothetical protein n=1 Tax=Streptomyces sp. NPDC051098 TaxID=3155411 RepID=UPI0034395642